MDFGIYIIIYLLITLLITILFKIEPIASIWWILFPVIYFIIFIKRYNRSKINNNVEIIKYNGFPKLKTFNNFVNQIE